MDATAGATLGAACAADTECPTGAFCLTVESDLLFGGAPPAGTCVAFCDAVSGCAAFTGATCVAVDAPSATADGGQSANGLCFEACQVGGGTGAAAKCHDRAQIACAPIEGASHGAGYCRPLCATGGQCLSGVCDPARSVCVPRAPADPAFGLRCPATSDGGAVQDGSAADGPSGAPDASRAPDGGDRAALRPPPCAGLCVEVSTGSSLCTRRCLFGSTDECAPELDGRRRGGCLFVTNGGGIGDLGYCAELCDCNTDCSDPSLVCDAFDDANLDAAFTRKGVCTPPELMINRPLPCAN